MVTCFGCTLQVLPQDVVWNVAVDLFAQTLCSVDLDQKKTFRLLPFDLVIVVVTFSFEEAGHIMWMQGVSDHGDLDVFGLMDIHGWR